MGGGLWALIFEQLLLPVINADLQASRGSGGQCMLQMLVMQFTKLVQNGTVPVGGGLWALACERSFLTICCCQSLMLICR